MKRFVSLVLVLMGATGLVWSQRQAIYDWSRLRGYEPPAAIAQLATDTTMNDSARRLFYVYHPALNDRAAFSKNCQGFGEQTIVLGCYVSNLGIYLFDLDDPRLAGVEQVTAAHEMLHAAYHRLSSEERTRIDKLTQAAFEDIQDERIKKTIENYRHRDPSIVSDELHSIIATEVRSISPELEEYYKGYFTDRTKIVAFSEKYEALFTEQRNRAAALEVQITGLKHEIDQLEQTLTDQREELQRSRPLANTQAEVNALNARVIAYNAHIQDLNDLIEQHNRQVEEYKANALEQQELFNALNSKPTL